MKDTLTAYNTNTWIDVLDDLVENYNNTEHGTTGFKPNKVGEKEMKEIQQQKAERIKTVNEKVEKFEVLNHCYC